MQHILFITCSSGHGHTVATHNIKAELALKHPDATVHMLDMVNYFYPVKPIIVNLWNAGIRQDSLIAHYLPAAVGVYEFFYDYFFGQKLASDIQALFSAYPIDTVIDTQPVFTPFLVRQMAAATQTPVTYHKVLTDLPVNKTHPCFSGIKKRAHFDNVTFLLHSNKPLATKKKHQAHFWEKYCKINPVDVHSRWSKPVHTAFKQLPNNMNNVQVNIHPKLASYYGLSSTNNLSLPENAQVTTLMMGSQGLEAIEEYFNGIWENYSNQLLNVPHYFFVACSRNHALFDHLMQKCLRNREKNSNLYIIPLEMQTPENIASMMWRSQTIILRASGLSCMEQLAMDETAKAAGVPFSPKRYIHSHCKRKVPSGLNEAEQSAFLLSHSVGHEKANSIYLNVILGAMLTRADLIKL